MIDRQLPRPLRHLCIPEVEKKNQLQWRSREQGRNCLYLFYFFNNLRLVFTTDWLSLIIISIAFHECERRKNISRSFCRKRMSMRPRNREICADCSAPGKSSLLLLAAWMNKWSNKTEVESQLTTKNIKCIFQ